MARNVEIKAAVPDLIAREQRVSGAFIDLRLAGASSGR
jgi:hypothetical protein